MRVAKSLYWISGWLWRARRLGKRWTPSWPVHDLSGPGYAARREKVNKHCRGFVQAPGALIAQRACRTGKKKEREKEREKGPNSRRVSIVLVIYFLYPNVPVFLRNIRIPLGILLLNNSTLHVSFLEPGKEGTTQSTCPHS